MLRHCFGFLARCLGLLVAAGLLAPVVGAAGDDAQLGITAFDRRVAGSYITPDGDFFEYGNSAGRPP